MPDNPIKVLLIEDEPAHVRLIRRSLARPGGQRFDIEAAGTIKQGLAALQSTDKPFDVILTDLGLPDSPDHRKTLSPILAAARTVPVIVLTALSDTELSLEAIGEGAQDYLPKDEIDSELLIRAIRYAIYRKQTELQLRQVNETLEQRVAERTAQLRLLASELSQAEQRERRRLAQLLHDGLQQSLVAVKMRLSLVPQMRDQGKLESLVDQLSDYVQRAIEESRSLALQLSPPILTDQGLGAALDWLGRRIQDEHGLHVDVDVCDTPSRLSEDAASFLFQAVRELLFNVVKYAGINRAQVVMHRPSNDELAITVSDKGAGFDQSKLDRPQQTAEHFGLFSVRQRLQLIGGTFELQSVPGQGTAVTLRLTLEGSPEESADLPIAAPPQNVNHWTKPPRTPSEVCRVVLVDDQPLVREGVRGMLRAVPDIEVIAEATDGEEAIEQVQRVHPDVVIMDVTMPKLSGIEATRQITQRFPGVRIIGLSMYPEDQMGAAMRQAGAAVYLPKDGPADALINAIRSLAPAPDKTHVRQ